MNNNIYVFLMNYYSILSVFATCWSNSAAPVLWSTFSKNITSQASKCAFIFTTFLVGGNPSARRIRILIRGGPVAEWGWCCRETSSWPSSAAPVIRRHRSTCYTWIIWMIFRHWSLFFCNLIECWPTCPSSLGPSVWGAARRPVRERGTPSASAISSRRIRHEPSFLPLRQRPRSR